MKNDPLNAVDPSGMAGCTGSLLGSGCEFVNGSEARDALFSRQETLREAGMDGPAESSLALANAAEKVAEGASVAGDVIEDGYKAGVGGGILGAVLKLFRLGRAAPAVTEIADVTSKGSRYANVSASLTPSQFEANLIESGYKVVKITTRGNGPVTILTKDRRPIRSTRAPAPVRRVLK